MGMTGKEDKGRRFALCRISTANLHVACNLQLFRSVPASTPNHKKLMQGSAILMNLEDLE